MLIEINLKDFTTEELQNELKTRDDYDLELREIWQLKRTNRNYEKQLDDYIRDRLGTVV